jgi:hypothetical protein
MTGVLVLLVGCGGSTAERTVVTTAAASTTYPVTSASPSTSTSTTTGTTTSAPPASSMPAPTGPTTAAPAAGDWNPACRAATSGAGGPSGAYAEASLDRFGPLAATPSLDITLPVTTRSMVDGPPDASSAAVTPVRVEGGVLLAVSAGSTGVASSSIVTVVERDGTKRWVRCVPGMIVGIYAAPPSSRPTVALLGTQVSVDSTGGPTTWSLLSLATGATVGGLQAAASQAGVDPGGLEQDWIVAASATAVLLGYGPDGPGSVANITRLVRYHLASGQLEPIPPPVELRAASPSAGIELGADDDVILTDTSAAPSSVRSVRVVFHAGAWTRESSALAAAIPITVGFGPPDENGTAGSLQGVDASGRIVWTRPEYRVAALEGSSLVTDDAMAIAGVCTASAPTTPGGPANCTRFAVVGVQAATGQPVWSLDGYRSVTAVGDGHVLIQDGPAFDPSFTTTPTPGWVLIDDRTGRPLDAAQHWTDPEAFRHGCCGESEYVWVARSGGVLFARNDRHLRVWYPKAEGTATVAVAVP